MVIGDATLANINASAGSSQTGTDSAAELSTQFLTLLIAQMQNQDPLNPTSNADLTSQLAQINTVSGIQELNQTLSSVTSQIDASQRLQASSLIGRGVLVEGDRIVVGEADGEAVTPPFGFSLDSAASDVQVSILDAAGQEVQAYDLGAQSSGVHSLSWDGSTASGGVAEAGSYRVVISASSDGQAVTVTALNYAYVSGVITAGSSASRLDLGTAGDAALDEIYQIL
ncbi:flagellar hook assembly protein FlgD [Halotalea alkalilenta]|uniref:flagellar hook assembly protein FlgD n=1 Tax=Halotalea alkalilenta TaxID=376489 RepID=UPI00047F6795|nr:flagellar hook assembly protein FlgD [Halotalea alkalilenta]